MTRDEIVVEARSWLGTPWHHQGRLKGVGVDCVGVAVGVARHFDIVVEDQTDYALSPFDQRLQLGLAQHCARTDKARPGDIVLFRFKGHPQHVGIDCGKTFVHCWQSAAVCIEQHWTAKWERRVADRFVLPGVDS